MNVKQLQLDVYSHHAVALVYDDNGDLYDECWNWETGQVYANRGYKVIAIANDKGADMDGAQALYDTELRWAEDCFGVGNRNE